jgi:hypothetical protein
MVKIFYCKSEILSGKKLKTFQQKSFFKKRYTNMKKNYEINMAYKAFKLAIKLQGNVKICPPFKPLQICIHTGGLFMESQSKLMKVYADNLKMNYR